MLLLNLFFFLLYRSTLLDAARIKFSLPTGHHKKKPLKIRSVQPQINFDNYANTQFHGSTFWLVHSPCACAERYTLPAAFKLANISFILLRKMWRYPKMIYQAVFCKSFCYSRQLCYLQVRGKLTLRL